MTDGSGEEIQSTGGANTAHITGVLEKTVKKSRTTPSSQPEIAVKIDGRHERGRRRQQAVLDTARELFIQHGYRGSTLEAIIARAGGSRETIYRLYGGKSGLFTAIIAEAGEQFAASIVTPSALEMPPREGLMRLSMQLIAVWRSREGQAINRVVISEGLDAPALVEAWYRGGFKVSVEALAKYLESQSQAGQLIKLDAPLVARQFLALLIGELGYPLIAKTSHRVTTRRQVERCIDLIIRAYAPTSFIASSNEG